MKVTCFISKKSSLFHPFDTAKGCVHSQNMLTLQREVCLTRRHLKLKSGPISCNFVVDQHFKQHTHRYLYYLWRRWWCTSWQKLIQLWLLAKWEWRHQQKKMLMFWIASPKHTYKILIESDQPRFPVVVKYQDGFNHLCSLELSNHTMK